ncbi:phosphate:acyl-[acyl carrier protein] acyltransferase [Carboxydocella sporoproducens DSM 16521]|uniref:Phosphate acyltransferase n=2 Tax=Carboxydocella TaxID=178898 RepID=A0A1T4NUP5_9FIRM|nr:MULTISPECIES: phosphate acyltransferase PlsX [Carboxydocella]AVX20174.1 phosphate:acyl-[acyl carrier protein] acyltransferase [Carboxydocella thermautotrophica]AVX30593.1 phosphate:acyl-[acyl carrier protein] acyltransferase [Carboxydocella thermautotrophica]SJZ82971.1 phosphate:acyl-[acyl carrier protein] acyltransferase [Carboxydocella sporoproducens DSM 16521]
MKIVVDAMGGDHAPREIVKGAVAACRELNLGIILVGPAEQLREEITAAGGDGLMIEIVDAPEVIGMDEHPGQAVRKKRNSSLVVGVKLVKEGKGAAFVSAGNTGAAMAASLLGYGRIKGINRPAIATVMPTLTGRCLVLDVGANAEVDASNLLQFAWMGSIYAEKILAIPNPRVGLLNIGEEESKGTPVVQEAYQLLKQQSGLNFIGNVEGRDLPMGVADVVVCDGFTGNVVLKLAEGLARALLGMIKEAAAQSILAQVGGLLMKPAFTALKEKMDYREYGGAPLLGLQGITIISHGSSDARAIKNAIKVAARCVEQQVTEIISRLGDEYDEGK